MDIMKEFENWLPKWSEEKMQPIPDREHPDRWAVAWKDFQNEFLRENHDKLVEEYKSMTLKTHGMLEKEKKEKEREERQKQREQELESVQEEEKSMSEWEKVQAMLKKNQ